MRNDAVPEEITTDDIITTRRTLELCGDEHHSMRCMLVKGHVGRHECLSPSDAVSWPAKRAS